MFGRMTGYLLAFAFAAGLLATPVQATNESQAAVLGLLYTPGGREYSMGGAGTAGAQGPSSGYYNPSLLSWQARDDATYPYAVGSTYYKILESFGLNDMYYMYFPVVFHVPDWGEFSVNVTYLSLGEQERTDEQGNSLGTFQTYTVAIGATYSSMISRDASAGVTIKWFYDHLADAGAGNERGKPVGQGFALDAGVAYNPWRNVMLGAALRNYGPNVQYIDANQASPTPVNFNLGGSWKFIDSEYNDVTFATDIYKPLVQDSDNWYLAPILGWVDEDVYNIKTVEQPDGTTEEIEEKSTLREESRQVDLRLGLEYAYAEYVALRTGYFRDWDGVREWLTFGAGFQLPISSARIGVDFAYVHSLTDDDPNDGQQVYTVAITF